VDITTVSLANQVISLLIYGNGALFYVSTIPRHTETSLRPEDGGSIALWNFTSLHVVTIQKTMTWKLSVV